MKYKLYIKISQNNWEEISAYSSTQDIRYHKDINKLDSKSKSHRVLRSDGSLVFQTDYPQS